MVASVTEEWCAVAMAAGEDVTDVRSAEADTVATTSTASRTMLAATILIRFAVPNNTGSRAFSAVDNRSSHVGVAGTLI
jgi:hypothetical protein